MGEGQGGGRSGALTPHPGPPHKGGGRKRAAVNAHPSRDTIAPARPKPTPTWTRPMALPLLNFVNATLVFPDRAEPDMVLQVETTRGTIRKMGRPEAVGGEIVDLG